METLIPDKTEKKDDIPGLYEKRVYDMTEGEKIAKYVYQVAEILGDSLPVMNEFSSNRMLRMIIGLCHAEMKGGNNG